MRLSRSATTWSIVSDSIDIDYSEGDRALDLRWWAAANYLTVAQIYLKENPLLRQPLTAEQIKPRLLGHWGTSPALSMIYTVLNRLINLPEALAAEPLLVKRLRRLRDARYRERSDVRRMNS